MEEEMANCVAPNDETMRQREPKVVSRPLQLGVNVYRRSRQDDYSNSPLGGILPMNPFKTEIANWTPTTLREFVNRAVKFINAEDTFEALIAPRRSEME